MELCTKSDAKNGWQYQKWLFALSKISSKTGIGFISIFLLKARGLYLTILKRTTLSLSLKVETDQFVICLVLPECLSVKICCTSPSDSEANRAGADAESPFPLFFSFSASFKHSSPREKSLFVSNIVAKYSIFPRAKNGRSRKKNSGEAICSRYQRALSRFWARLRILNLIARLC